MPVHRVTCFLYDLTEFFIPQVTSRLNWANWRNCRSCIWTVTNLPVLYPSSLDLCRIWNRRLALHKPYLTSRIGWLVFCMFWLGFVYPRSHSGWIGSIGEFTGSAFRGNQLTGNQPFIPLTCIQYEGEGLLSLCPFIPVGYGDLFFVYFDWVLYPNQ